MREILERFKKYIAIETMSDPNADVYPSTESQREFGSFLVKDLLEIGIEDAMQDEYGVVYAHIDNKKEKTIGLIAHMDTAPTIQGGLKNPKLINKYDGSVIKLNEKYSMSKEDFPSLETVIGEDILVTDGEHLMGGDDKAGIAIIVEFAKYFISH